MLQELLFWWIFITLKLSTFLETSALNLSLLASFFLNGIELCNVNCAFKSALQKLMDLFSPVKRYGE